MAERKHKAKTHDHPPEGVGTSYEPLPFVEVKIEPIQFTAPKGFSKEVRSPFSFAM